MHRTKFLAIMAMAIVTGCKDHPSIAAKKDQLADLDAQANQALADADLAIARTQRALNGTTEATGDSAQDDLARICKAAVAVLYGRDPAMMHITKSINDLVRVEYRRPDDNTLWKNECILDGDRVLWRAVDAFPGSGPGKWQNGPYADVLTYTLSGKTVSITMASDGVAIEKQKFTID